ncbi:MAG: ABC transporter ATP-binding protein [Deltaproteobacteria bacterium]|nr:ABC transporter ATP-binding protein [Deltaproteobacteria bacterium]
MKPLLIVKDLRKSFGGLAAVEGVDFCLYENEILGLIGPNGSGKTTLFNLIAGALRPDGGRVEFEGRDITGLNPASVCKMGIARTFQVPMPFERLSVLDNVKLGRAYGSQPAETLTQAAREASEILEFIGLIGKGSLISGRLGLLDRKRLELGKALATRPKVLLLDEILGGLNPKEIEEAMDLIRKIRDSGITMIVVEHVMKAIMGISDRVVVLNSGMKLVEGLPGEVVKEHRVIEAYLGVDLDAEN